MFVKGHFYFSGQRSSSTSVLVVSVHDQSSSTDQPISTCQMVQPDLFHWHCQRLMVHNDYLRHKDYIHGQSRLILNPYVSTVAFQLFDHYRIPLFNHFDRG